jgi:hypothetical protein
MKLPMNKKHLLTIIIFIATSIFYIHIIKLPVIPFDEGTILVGAERLLKGEIPHKDFSTEYPAGQITILAALFKVFGTSVTTERIYDLSIKSLLSLMIFLIIRLLTSDRFAFFGWSMSLIWIASSRNPAYPIYPFFLIIFSSVYFLLLYIQRNKNFYVILCAIFAALSIPFRIDLGVPAAAIFALVLIIRRIMGIQPSWRPLIVYLLSAAIVVLTIFTYYASNSTIKLMFSDLILNPLAFLEHRWFPYPSLTRHTIPFYLFPLVTLTSIFTSIILIKRKAEDIAAYGVFFTALFGFVCLNQVRVRSDEWHLLPVAINCMILAPSLLYLIPKLLSLSANGYRIICTLFVLAFCIALYKPVKAIMLVVERTRGYVIEVVNPDIERARYSTIFSDLKDVVPYIKNNTSSEDYIYVGVNNHDRFIMNHPMIYFLAERKCPSRYHELNPGVNNTLKGQRDIVKELEAKPPRMVILAPQWREEPNPSSIDQKINLLDDYISTHYEYKKSFGIYEVWIEKSSP